MTRKKSSRKAKEPKAAPGGALDRRAFEKATAELNKLLHSRDFASIEELNAFLRDRLARGQGDIPDSQHALERAQDVMYRAGEARGDAA